MTLFNDNLTIVGQGIEGDSPGPGAAAALPDGIHLRWLFKRNRGFPWYGYYLLRRQTDSGWRAAFRLKLTLNNKLQELLDSLKKGNQEASYIAMFSPRPMVIVGEQDLMLGISFNQLALPCDGWAEPSSRLLPPS